MTLMTFPIGTEYAASVMRDYFSGEGGLPPSRIQSSATSFFEKAVKAREGQLGGDIGSYCAIAEALRSVHGREDIPREKLDLEMRALRDTCASIGTEAAKKEHFPTLQRLFGYISRKAEEQNYDRVMSGSWG